VNKKTVLISSAQLFMSNKLNNHFLQCIEHVHGIKRKVTTLINKYKPDGLKRIHYALRISVVSCSRTSPFMPIIVLKCYSDGCVEL
jgi:hypothetical protein